MITSTGGKQVRVFLHDDEVVVSWTDLYGADGDMPLSRDDARNLAAWIVRAADAIDEGEEMGD